MKKTISLIFLHYLRLLAKIQLEKVRLFLKLHGKKLTVIGITGSAGKTSTMLALTEILSHYYPTKSNYGANSESGIPLNILDIKIENFSIPNWIKVAFMAPFQLLTNWKIHQIYIVEMGIDEPEEPKNMGYLLRIIKPNIAIVLGVNPVHSMQFDITVPKTITGKHRLKKILHNIATEKAKIINQNPNLQTAIINIDDPTVKQVIHPKRDVRIITVGSSPNASLATLNTQSNPMGFASTFSAGKHKYKLELHNQVLPGIYHISFAAAIAAAKAIGISESDSVLHLNHFHSPPGRSSLFTGINESTIIDSSYNSSPGTAEEMLLLLRKFPHPKIAVLGDMRELGQQSAQAHQNLYRFATKIVDIIVSVGPQTKQYFGNKAIKFNYHWQASDYLASNLPPKASILVKGSQNTIYLEEIVKKLLKNPSDSVKLCRQSPYWLKLKSNFKYQSNPDPTKPHHNT